MKPLAWFLMTMVFGLYLSGIFAIQAGQTVVGLCGVAAAFAAQIAVQKLGDGDE